VNASQVLGSIVMFGVLYVLLFILWIVVLNQEIQHGPDPLPDDEPGRSTPRDSLEAAVH
jgi:cytochrome d ubiquinol oxidase subunit I